MSPDYASLIPLRRQYLSVRLNLRLHFFRESPAVFALSDGRELTVTRTSQPSFYSSLEPPHGQGCRPKLLPTGTRVLHVQRLPRRPLILLQPERGKRLTSEKVLPQIGRRA